MTSHLLYIVGCSVRNGLRRQARRLRSPRYAIAAAVGLLYFFSVFGGWLPAEEAGEQLGGVWLAIADRAGPLLIALLSARWWLWPSRHHGVRLSPAETHLLLPAPITRAQLIRFKILQAQPAILISALIATFFTRGTDLLWPLRFLSVWLLLATLHQHQVAATLVSASAQQHGRRGVRAHLLPILVFGAALATLTWRLLAAAADVRAAPSLDLAGRRLLALLDERAVDIVLAPFRLLLAPLLAPSFAAWLTAFGAALLVLAAHYLWVIRSDAAFEEAAIARGERVARLAQAAAAGGMARLQLVARDPGTKPARPWLPLAVHGPAAYAIFWKNVLAVQRTFRPAVVLRLGLVLLAVVLITATAEGRGVLSVLALLCLTAAGLASAFGPLTLRSDLRTDLVHADLLRTYPVRGRSLVAGGIAAVSACITISQLALLWTGLALLTVAGTLDPASALLAAALGLLALPVVNAFAVVIQNALALLYPSWVRLGETGPGVEMMGHTVLLLTASLVLLAVLALPPALIGAAVGAPLTLWIGGAGAAAGAAAALLAAAGEIVLLTRWLGTLYDRTDPSAVGLLK